MIKFDGQLYESADQIPDLGSWECVEDDAGKRQYWGLSADVEKLPKYDNLLTGSTALCLDNCSILGYHAPTKTWYPQSPTKA